MDLTPLSAGFGIEASGVDLSRPLSEEAFGKLRDAFYRHQLLVIRGQSLAPRQFSGFAARFGRPEPHVIDQFHHPEDRDISVKGVEIIAARGIQERSLAERHRGDTGICRHEKRPP